MVIYQFVLAQQNNASLISVNFQQAKIAQFVSDLEAKSNYHFFYDPIQMDSLIVTLQIENKPIQTIIDLAFKNTDYHFAVGSIYFFNKRKAIKNRAAPGFR